MAKHELTCRICGQKFDANVIQAVKIGNLRYAHQTCAPDCTDLVEMTSPKRKEKTKEEKEIEAIKDYAKARLGETYQARRVNKQIKDFHTEDGYSYSGILKTLIYHYEVKGGDPSKALGGIGIVPYLYNEARDYYLALWLAQEANKKVDVVNYTSQVREVNIDIPKREPFKPKTINFIIEGEYDNETK